MSINDDKLGKMLKMWLEIETSPAFEQNVWRRIRQLPKESANQISFGDLIFSWLSVRPAYAATVIVAGVIVGFSLALTVQVPSSSSGDKIFKSFPDRSLSASFIQLAGGKIP